MANNKNQKLKTLYLMELLRKETDPSHGLTMPQIIEQLAQHGIQAERKSLYKDLDALREFGLDIRMLNTRPVSYALCERDFELPQLSLLIDAVQSSRFLSEGSSRALVKSIRAMASTSEKDALNKQVHVHGRPKKQSQSDFVAVDILQQALAHKKKVSFQYFRWDARLQKAARKSGAEHIVTPINLTYSDGNYYLVAYSEADGEIRNYRVDRMESIKELAEAATKNEMIANYDANEVGKCVFGMYEGKRIMARLKASSDVMNVIVDRFGRDIDFRTVDDGNAAEIYVHVKASPVFYGWLAQMGGDIQILEPSNLKHDYLAWLESIVEAYRSE